MERIRRALDQAGSRSSLSPSLSSSLSSSIYRSSPYSSSDERIVIDIGVRFTKVGIAGEHQPRFIVPVSSHHHGTTPSSSSSDPNLLWDTGMMNPDHVHQLHIHFIDHLSAIFFHYLLIDPKNKTIIITESVFCPIVIKYTIVSVLFHHFRIASLYFIPSELATILTTGRSSGLVLDCGYLDSTVTPVIDHHVLTCHAQSFPLACQSILFHFRDLITKFGYLFTPIKEYQVEPQQSTTSSANTNITSNQSLSPITSYWLTWSHWALGLISHHRGISPSPDTMALAAGVGHGHTIIPWTNDIIEQLLSTEFLDVIKTQTVFVGSIPVEGEYVTISEPTTEQLSSLLNNMDNSIPSSTTNSSSSPLYLSSFSPSQPNSSNNFMTSTDLPPLPPSLQPDPFIPPYLINQYHIYKSNASTVYYPLGKRGTSIAGNRNVKLIIPGWIRERAAEALFHGNDDDQSIATLILQVLLSCSNDIRAMIIPNIVITGGTTLIPGFLPRLKQQISHHINTNPIYNCLRDVHKSMKFFTPGHGQFQYGAWTGASLAGSLKILNESVLITQTNFLSWCTDYESTTPTTELPQFNSFLVSDWSLGMN